MTNLRRFLVHSSLSLTELGSGFGERAVTVLLTPDETHHLRNVLHMKKGNECVLFDREGNECVGQIELFKEDGSAEIRLLDRISQIQENHLKLSVAQAIPQDRKMDEIVRKSAELGIYELIPLETQHTVVRMREEAFKKASERWNRILSQAAKQSRNFRLPQIKPLTSFDQLCSQFSRYDDVFLLHPSKEAKPIRECQVHHGSVLLAIGPEGGFSDGEVKLARAKGAQLISMGSEIMRTDTAFVAAASFFKLMGEY
jgi:16S rRNA (uracil1498-N3)-methyltransferase